MKKLLFLSVLFFMLISCNQGIPQLEFDGMNGKVQRVRESKYEAIEKFGEVIPGDLEEVSIIDFDKDGHLRKHFVYDEEGDRLYGFEYSFKDDVIIQTKYYGWREKEPEITDLLSYDEKSYNYKCTSKDTTYTYTSNIFEDKLYRKITHPANDNVIEAWFNEIGQVVEEKQTIRGELIFWVVNKYNDDNMLVESECRGENPSRRLWKHKEFDANGNWITAILFERDDAYLLKRDIKYW